ncbi:hypothetical protein [Pedobacter frigoris]|uniref:Uncharacterized protein n=1 Tax=Pedobacter frigoris TaxID=2571272 RepID=A0A4U1CFP4_9SPHI|nr:hypothetical protein [Pedobacter frigoris]TKC05167.1 hypothetical protein FA047_15520 [Pedobacter frigoris]
MFDLKTFKQKSPQQRFLLILGLVMFAFYLVLGITLIAWKDMPVTLERSYRIALGVLLIVYAAIRFARVNKQKAD